MFVVPQNDSICGLRRTLFAGQNLIRDDRSGYREQRQKHDDRHRFHGINVAPDCGRKCQSLAHFQDEAGKQSWPRALSCAPPKGYRRRSSSPGAGRGRRKNHPGRSAWSRPARGKRERRSAPCRATVADSFQAPCSSQGISQTAAAASPRDHAQWPPRAA